MWRVPPVLFLIVALVLGMASGADSAHALADAAEHGAVLGSDDPATGSRGHDHGHDQSAHHCTSSLCAASFLVQRDAGQPLQTALSTLRWVEAQDRNAGGIMPRGDPPVPKPVL